MSDLRQVILDRTGRYGADAPACKVLDYGKFKCEAQKKAIAVIHWGNG